MAYVNLSHMPNPKTEYVENFVNLNGGLNIQELEYRLKNDESPEMKNLLWREGVLCSRDGQEWLIDTNLLGAGIAMYDRPFHDHLVAHIGSYICVWPLHPVGPVGAWMPLNGIPEIGTKRGTFFHYFDKLYYKAPGVYVVIWY